MASDSTAGSSKRGNEAGDKAGDELPTAAAFMPARLALPQLRQASAACRGCPLTAMPRRRSSATGRPRRRSCSSARSCGEQEDRAGKPFVGPAGNLLDRAGRGADRPRGSLPHQRGEALQVRAARQASDSPQAIGAGDPGVPAVAQERDRRRQAEAAGVSGGDGGAGAARQGVSRDPIARAGAARHAMGTGGCSARLRQADQMARRLYSRVG